MPEQEHATEALLVRVHPLERRDWFGRSGQFFRNAFHRASAAVKQTMEDAGVHPRDVPTRAVELAVDKLEGAAQKDKAAAVRDFSEAEELKIKAEYQKRSMNSRLRKEEAEAELAEIAVEAARVELFLRLKAAGVSIVPDAHGNYKALSASSDPRGYEQFERLEAKGDEPSDDGYLLDE